MRRLIVFDLDLTLWDHSDISVTTPPYRRLDEDLMVDASGVPIRLRQGVRSLLRWLQSRNMTLAIVSWNIEWIAMEALKTLSIYNYFTYMIIEYHPRKDKMFEKLFRASGFTPSETIYIDDDVEMIKLVTRRYPEIYSIVYAKDVSSMKELRRLLEDVLS